MAAAVAVAVVVVVVMVAMAMAVVVVVVVVVVGKVMCVGVTPVMYLVNIPEVIVVLFLLTRTIQMVVLPPLPAFVATEQPMPKTNTGPLKYVTMNLRSSSSNSSNSNNSNNNNIMATGGTTTTMSVRVQMTSELNYRH